MACRFGTGGIVCQMVKPRYVALDSSVLGNLARDLCCTKRSRRAKAASALDHLSGEGFIPLVTLPHMMELTQHEDYGVVENRLHLLRHMPHVAWIASSAPDWLVGSIPDIFAAEVHGVLCQNTPSTAKTLRWSKTRLLRFGTGQQFMDRFTPAVVRSMHYAAVQQMARNREIVSLRRARFTGLEDCRLSEFVSEPTRSRSEILQYARILLPKLQEALRKTGDKKLRSRGRTARRFLQDVLDNDISQLSLEDHSLDQLLAHFGLDACEVSGKEHLTDLGYKAVFRRNLRQAARTLDFDYDALLDDVREEDCPSWHLWRELDRAAESAIRASGSDLHDFSLAVLSLYADVTIVDKRTNELLRQVLKRTPQLGEVSNVFFNVANYMEIRSKLPRVPGT